MPEHRARREASDRAVGATQRWCPASAQEADGDAEPEDEWDGLDEDEVVGELAVPRLRAGAGLPGDDQGARDRYPDTAEDDEPARDGHGR